MIAGFERTERAVGAAVLLLAAGCSLSPLSHRIHPGEEPFVVFVGNGTDGNVDLFAASAGGGDAVQFTFTPLIEAHPRLDPSGSVVAFLRMRDTLAATPRFLVMMNLISGAEVQTALPPEAGRANAVGWAGDGSRVYVGTDRGVWQVTAPPATVQVTAVTAANRAGADSALAVWVGSPPVARAVPCPHAGICVVGSRNDTQVVSASGSDVMRWGRDSMAWFDSSSVVVRYLGPGHERHITWTSLPSHPRDGTMADTGTVR